MISVQRHFRSALSESERDWSGRIHKDSELNANIDLQIWESRDRLKTMVALPKYGGSIQSAERQWLLHPNLKCTESFQDGNQTQ